MSTLADIRTKLISLVADDAAKLVDPDDYETHIQTAIKIYSNHKPETKVVDVVGNGTNDLDLPAGWNSEFSSIINIEYPVGNIPAALLEKDHYQKYKNPSGEKIRLLLIKPTNSENIRITFTVLRTDTTVPDSDVEALVFLAASLCCEQLSNAYAQSTDSTLNADSVDHNSKTSDFAKRAKQLKLLYNQHMGLKQGDIITPAAAITSMDYNYPGGGARLTHSGRKR